jgi:RNA polymerase primary sigma factor
VTTEFAAFVREVGSRRVLTREEEVELAKRVEAGDREARRVFAEHNMRLVISTVKPYARMGYPMEDLFQEGAVGLMKAVDRFDHTKGFKFSTYATWWIKQAALRYISGNGGVAIRVPGRFQKIRRDVRKRVAQTGETPEQAAAALEISSDDLTEAMEGPRVVASLDVSSNPDEEGGASEGRHASIPDPAAVDPGDFVSENYVALHAAMEYLTDRQREVLRLRFGFEGPVHSMSDTAEVLGVSPRVVQAEQKAALAALQRTLDAGEMIESGADERDARVTAVFNQLRAEDAARSEGNSSEPECRIE